ESFAVVLVDEDGDSTNGSLDVTVLDDVPQFNSVMDAVLSSHTHVTFDGRYDANFGADGLDYLSVALASSGLYGGSAVTFVLGAPDVDGVVRVDVTNGLNVVLFSFYYETTISAASDGGDGTVSFNAFTNPLDPDHSQFFTLTVNPDGTYTFDMVSNTVISTTTVDGEDFTAFGPTYSVYTADGVPGTSDLPSLIIYGSDGDGVTDADDQVNASSQGIGVKTPTIGSGESLMFDFEKNQSYVKFSLQQFSGGGSATFMILLNGVIFDFYPLLAADGLTITKPSSGDAWVEVIVTENVGQIGTWAQTGTAAEPVYTLYVGSQFDGLTLEHDAGSLKFNVNHITYDQTIAVEDLQLNFNLAATDMDGDTSALAEPLTVMMLDPSEPVSATAVGADANDGVVLVGNGEADVLTGGMGDDILLGKSDNDQLYGGGGNDLLDGGSGDDLLDGGAGSDTASYMDAGAGVTVDLNIVGAQNTVGAGQDTLVSIENLTGSSYDDILTGDDSDNVLIGGGGQDILTGNGGSDTFKWGSGDASAGVDVIKDFQVGVGGDVLDLSELLSGEHANATSLDQFLTFSSGPGSGKTTLVIDLDGSGAGTTTQTIQFDNIDLTMGGTRSDQQIIDEMLLNGNLKVDP
ncbi:type I secretion C-terminal target domain-containing protein, partial [Aeromonas schubertii]